MVCRSLPDSLVWLVAGLACALGATTISAAQGASLRPSDSWNTFTADISIRRQRIADDGKTVVARFPAMTYRWERTQTMSGWRTTMILLDGERPKVQSLRGPVDVDPYSITRIEDDGDGSPLRLIGPDGRIAKPPAQLVQQGIDHLTGSDPSLAQLFEPGVVRSRPWVTGRDWVDTFIVSPAKSTQRRSALAMRYGNPMGRSKGMDRYVSFVRDEQVEVLADPATALPVETRVSRDGVLVGLTTVTYAHGIGDALVRRAVHSERRLADGGRTVIDMDFANVRLEQRRAR